MFRDQFKSSIKWLKSNRKYQKLLDASDNWEISFDERLDVELADIQKQIVKRVQKGHPNVASTIEVTFWIHPSEKETIYSVAEETFKSALAAKIDPQRFDITRDSEPRYHFRRYYGSRYGFNAHDTYADLIQIRFIEELNIKCHYD